jgi:Phage tail tube protein
MAKETTYATPATVTRFLEYNSETIKQTIARLDSMGLRPSRRILRTNQWLPGRISVTGDTEMEVQTNGFGLLFRAMLGEEVGAKYTQPNAGSFPTVYEGKFRVGATDGTSWTIQKAMGSSDGTVRAFTYGGAKVDKWELHAEENGFLKLKSTWDAANESTSIGLAAAAYTAGSIPLSYVGAVLKYGGSEVTNIKKFTLTGANNFGLARYFMREKREKKEQLEDKLRTLTGSIDVEFENLSQYEKYAKSEEATLEANFQGKLIAGTYNYGVNVKLAAVRFDGETPVVPGPGIVDVSIPFTALEAGTEATACEIVYTTTDTVA